MKIILYFCLFLFLLLLGPLLMRWSSKINMSTDWEKANRESAGLAPNPNNTPEALVQVYGARAFNWRGLFAVHTWIAVKPAHAQTYTVYQVLGWRHLQKAPVVVINDDIPDRYWFGSPPEIYNDIRGAEAEEIIHKIKSASDHYPYANIYILWPGPNSNTYVAFLGREIPELKINLPITAIGMNYLPNNRWLVKAPSGTGFEFSIRGYAGITFANVEGFRINLFGFVFGISWHKGLALLWPGIGRIGF